MNHDDPFNSTLAATAYWTAAVRARESKRQDRLFHDPWAAKLAGEQGASWIAQHTEDATLPMVVRTRYFDDFLTRITVQEGVRNLVLLAAGLDTRAFRLNWSPGVRLFELDQPAIQKYKEAILRLHRMQPACERRSVCQDLTRPWKNALQESGFGRQERSGWLLEGVLFYLSTETLASIFDTITSLAAPGSWLGCDLINSAALTSPYTKAWIEMQARSGAPWIGFVDDPESFLGSRGWECELTQAGQPDANYGRWTLPVIPTKMPNMPHYWFVTAKKSHQGD